MRALVTHPPDPRPAAIVATVPRVGPADIAEIKERMVGFGCASALLFDSESCVILRDTFTSLDVDSIQEEARVPTADVLAYVPYAGASSLDERVLRWVEGMAASWTASLPQERATVAPFIADIVPALSGASVRKVA